MIPYDTGLLGFKGINYSHKLFIPNNKQLQNTEYMNNMNLGVLANGHNLFIWRFTYLQNCWRRKVLRHCSDASTRTCFLFFSTFTVILTSDFFKCPLFCMLIANSDMLFDRYPRGRRSMYQCKASHARLACLSLNPKCLPPGKSPTGE